MKVKIQTTLGDIIMRLYDETPIHRDNFVKFISVGPGTFTMQDWDNITNELKRFW